MDFHGPLMAFDDFKPWYHAPRLVHTTVTWKEQRQTDGI